MPPQHEHEVRFDGRVAIVTGAGRGIGRAHAHALAARGAKVIVNDLGGTLSGDGDDPAPAAAVAREIVAAGGDAVANSDDVATEAGASSIVASALERYDRVDVVVTNAGNLAVDQMPSVRMDQLNKHLDIHVVGTFNVTRAAWGHMAQQGYGRVVMTTSVGLFGGAFLISYSTAKGGVVSLGRSLAIAGVEHGIKVNLLAPVADTRMVNDAELRARSNIPPLEEGAEPDPNRSPEQVAPMMLVLAHERCPVNGEILEAGLGRFARVFIGETAGIVAPDLGPEGVLARWSEIVDESGYKTHASTKDAITFRERLITSATEAA
jgi:NAD(P)-dependent dehydrogenase (short-subunit alcohol dehydrogenase family)